MRILWFTWKDGRHPGAGGAEAVNEEMAVRLVRAGHSVTFVAAGFPGATADEWRDGFRVVRVGGRWSVYWRAWRLYRRRLAGTADLVLDEVNTVFPDGNLGALAAAIVDLHQHGDEYARIRRAAWTEAKDLSFDASFDVFAAAIERT